MMALLSFIATPLGRAGLIAAGILAAMAGFYGKGRLDGRAACIATGEKDVRQTTERAARARAAADRATADAGRLRDDDTFRRD